MYCEYVRCWQCDCSLPLVASQELQLLPPKTAVQLNKSVTAPLWVLIKAERSCDSEDRVSTANQSLGLNSAEEKQGDNTQERKQKSVIVYSLKQICTAYFPKIMFSVPLHVLFTHKTIDAQAELQSIFNRTQGLVQKYKSSDFSLRTPR